MAAEERDVTTAEERDVTTADLARTRRPADTETPNTAMPNAERDEEFVAEPGPPDGGEHEQAVPLLAREEVASAEGRWTTIQTSFVDEPQKAVRDADALVAEVMQQLARSFADERDRLESQWKQGQDVSTEDLRQALQRYRSFFQRLLAA